MSKVRIKYLTVREYAKELRVTLQAIYQRVASGQLPADRIGSAMRIPREAFEARIARALHANEKDAKI
jgi:excisionase family DNA binding protein